VIDISECLRPFLEKFLFENANMMSKHFGMARGTITDIQHRDLRLRSSPVDGCHISSSQKADRVNPSRTLLHMLQQLQPFDFEGMTTGDESWFRYEYESDSMFAPSAGMVRPRLRA
jgi:hypothetical protein